MVLVRQGRNFAVVPRARGRVGPLAHALHAAHANARPTSCRAPRRYPLRRILRLRGYRIRDEGTPTPGPTFIGDSKADGLLRSSSTSTIGYTANGHKLNFDS